MKQDVKTINRAKKLGLIAATALLVAFAWAAPVSNTYAAEAPAAQSQSVVHTINVTGKGEITVTPDVAYVTFGIETKAATAKESQKANAAKFAKLKQALTNSKVKTEDVQTVGFYVNPEYSYNEKTGPKLTGYSTTHTVQVTYRDLDGLGDLMDAASEAGVNQVQGVRFDTEHPEMYETQVLEKAMKNAEVKAKAIASAAKQQIVSVITVSESSADVYPIFTNQVYATAKMESAAADTSIQSGQISIKSNVTVVYEIK
ncbi:SIMPL domain-containing protein [Paenibacillus guangzhouensis]|uniref:SIMPL domain-containing protein n=1 Tax=Paenibacillus guangzhouensis TaxID=1473112 RepID=UPI001267464A|nr:SIMPL domain-containing protein [Paenibacillus guangzhouensis]